VTASNKNDQSKQRCSWCEKDELYRNYHDTEWGEVSHDDHHLFEHLILETFQAGLSWHTILVKRENFRLAFDQFNAEKIAKYSEKKIEELMNNAGIIRYRAKIKAAINNAQKYLEVKKEYGSFDRYMWQFTKNKVITNKVKTWDDVLVNSPESDAMCKDLKSRGFKFVGSTTCYAYMQSVGMVNDHFDYCWKK
jgi:DNA-3-methyladenine glycosylase I